MIDIKVKFHIIWEIQSSPQLTTGKDYEAETMINALEMFAVEFPELKPLNVVDKSQLR